MIETIITSSVLIAAMILLRLFFSAKISRRLQYALWGLVLLRLCLPFPLFSSPVSVMNALDMDSLAQSASEIRIYSDFIPNTDMTPDEAREAGRGTLHEIRGYASDSKASYLFTDSLDVVAARIGKAIWLTGSIAVGLWLTGATILFYLRLRKNRRIFQQPEGRLKVYLVPGIASPCLFGIFRPAIYLTPKAVEDEDSLRHVLLHEFGHYRHGDHIWAVLRGLCLAAYWWNPLVWAAAILSRTDGELACDEAVVRRIGESNRFAYGRTLIDMIAVQRSPASCLCAATTMISGKQGFKKRLDAIVKNPRTFASAMVAVLLMVAVMAGCTFTGAAGEAAETPPLSAADALKQLAESVAHSEDQVSFQIPAGYQKPDKWDISIEGRPAPDGPAQRLPLLKDVNDGRAWEPGKNYSIPLEDGYAGLTLTARLPDDNGGILEKSVNLLDPSVITPSYELARLGKDGKVIQAVSPLEGEYKELAESVIVNHLIKSAAWPGLDIKALDECWLLRATYSDGTVTDYYAFMHEGHAVMQRGGGKDGMYSRIDDELYEKLTELPDSISASGNGNRLQAAVDRTDLEACITEAILSKNAGKNKNYDFAAESHIILKAVEEGNRTTVYAMALYQEFGFAGNGFMLMGGSHMPVAITFEQSEAGRYELTEYWVPKDGSYYLPSLREKFPADIRDQAIDTQAYITPQMQNCYKKAVEFGGGVVNVEIRKLFDAITSSPAPASNPGGYLDAHPLEHRELLYYGDYTLRYVFAEFLKGGQTGLDGHIMLAVMRELIGGEDASIEAATAQEWFDEWKDRAVQILNSNSMEHIQKDRPKTYLLLQMLNEKEN